MRSKIFLSAKDKVNSHRRRDYSSIVRESLVNKKPKHDQPSDIDLEKEKDINDSYESSSKATVKDDSAKEIRVKYYRNEDLLNLKDQAFLCKEIKALDPRYIYEKIHYIKKDIFSSHTPEYSKRRSSVKQDYRKSTKFRDPN